MITIAVVNTKGGVGKTTITAMLSVIAAQEGKHVALVDMDPQKSLIGWWQRRGKSENPKIFEGPDTAFDAVESLGMDTTSGKAWDYCFIDGPPAFLTVVQEMVEAADFVLIPVKPSMMDLLASEDAVALAQQADVPYAVVFNDLGSKETKIVEEAKGFLFNAGIPMLKSALVHRVSHMNAMTKGRTAGEGADEKAAKEIEAVWHEVKKLAAAAAKARSKRKEAAHG